MVVNPDISILGTIVFDIFIPDLEKIPSRGTAVEIKKINYTIGGCASNPAILLTKLGIKVSLVGIIGRDAGGEFIKEFLEANGINTSSIKISEKNPTSTSILFIDKYGERRYLHLKGATSDLKIDSTDFEYIYKSKILHIGGANLLPSIDGKPMAQILKKAKSKKIITSVDLAWDVDNLWMEKLKYSIPYIDILMGNQDEIKALTGKKNLKSASKMLHDLGIKIVVIKLGNKGSFVSKDFDQFEVPPFKVKSVDATGAGDAFAGGFLFGILSGKNLYECAKLGNYFGAIVTTEIGSTTALFKHKHFNIQKILET
jgi:sugar/nucleoside kinase (ribokinase family)